MLEAPRHSSGWPAVIDKERGFLVFCPGRTLTRLAICCILSSSSALLLTFLPSFPLSFFCFLFATNAPSIGIFLRLRGVWNAVLGAFSSRLPDSPRSLVDETRGDFKGSFWPQPLSTHAFYTSFRGRRDSVFCWPSTESHHSFRLCSSIHSASSRRFRCS